ncbi:MAG: AI-2E family transporter [Syntrophomonadaceae bacterium]|nr:AI-2E family transporter [Syntrophomonadaceae bacterium]
MNSIKGLGEFFNKEFLKSCKYFLIFAGVYSLLFVVFIKTLSYSAPFIFALILAYAVQPVINFCVGKGKIKRGAASFAVTVLILLVFIGLLAAFLAIITREIVQLISYLGTVDYSQILNSWREKLSFGYFINLTGNDIIQALEDNVTQLAKSLSNQTGVILKWILAILTSIPTWIMMTMVIVFSTFFFIRDIDKIQKMPGLIFNQEGLKKSYKLIAESKAMLGKYIMAYVKLMIFTFLSSLLLYVTLGVNYALLLGILTAVADLIPILGPGIILLSLAVISFANGQVISAVALVAGWIIIAAVRQILESKWVSDSIDVHPVTVIAILFIGLKAGSFILIIYLIAFVFFWKVLNKINRLSFDITRD